MDKISTVSIDPGLGSIHISMTVSMAEHDADGSKEKHIKTLTGLSGHGSRRSVELVQRTVISTVLVSLQSSRRIPVCSSGQPSSSDKKSLTSAAGPEIVLQKQYRPPLDKIVIELPAGLVDEGETAEQAAIRELREETGYVAEVMETSPVMFNGMPPTLTRYLPP